METFAVERYLPGSDQPHLVAIAEQLATSDLPAGVHYRGSIIVVGDEACICLFDAESADHVRAANAALGLPVARVVPAAVVQPALHAGPDTGVT